VPPGQRRRHGSQPNPGGAVQAPAIDYDGHGGAPAGHRGRRSVLGPFRDSGTAAPHLPGGRGRAGSTPTQHRQPARREDTVTTDHQQRPPRPIAAGPALRRRRDRRAVAAGGFSAPASTLRSPPHRPAGRRDRAPGHRSALRRDRRLGFRCRPGARQNLPFWPDSPGSEPRFDLYVFRLPRRDRAGRRDGQGPARQGADLRAMLAFDQGTDIKLTLTNLGLFPKGVNALGHWSSPPSGPRQSTEGP